MAQPLRVAGTDPGTSSLDVLILEDGIVGEQCRFTPQQLQDDASLPVRWLSERGPFHLIAGPSGYGLPLMHAADCTERDLALMTLVRPDERGPDDARRQGVLGFSSLLRAFRASDLPVVFLPGVIHLPTVPAHRKINRIDLSRNQLAALRDKVWPLWASGKLRVFTYKKFPLAEAAEAHRLMESNSANGKIVVVR